MNGNVYSGGTSKFTSIKLPGSSYYNDAPMWRYLNTDVSNYPANYADTYSSLVYCGGYLYQWVADALNVYDPNTGKFIKTITVPNKANTSHEATDGVRHIWIYINQILYEFDTLTESIIELTNMGVNYDYNFGKGICYDPVRNGIYMLGGRYTNSSDVTSGSGSLNFVSRLDGSRTNLKSFSPDGIPVYMFVDGNYLYAGMNPYVSSATSNAIHYAKYDISANTWTTMSNETKGVANISYQSSIYFNNKVHSWHKTSSSKTYYEYDPINGGNASGVGVSIGGFPDISNLCRHSVAQHGNSLWAIGEGGMTHCTLYAGDLIDNPIVAKIYNGQKFHSNIPFEIQPYNISVTTEPQTAQQDIFIRKYDYTSDDLIWLYIEDA